MPSSLGGRAGRRPWLLVAAALAACSQPVVGDPLAPAAAPAGYRLAIGGASVDALGHVQVAFSVTRDAAPVPAAALVALGPSFTLAGLEADPVSGLATWRSRLLVGSGTLQRLPPGGPGTPAELVLRDQRQPGAVEASPTNLTDLGGGRFAIDLGAALPPGGFDPTRTLRVGAWLGGVPGTDDTSATHDWVPSGGTPARRETVLDANCKGCHGRLTGHGGFRTGVKLCLTCHTIQNADPDTVDPAALGRALTVAPDERTVVAGAGPVTFTATLLASAAAVEWRLSPATGAGQLLPATVATTSAGSASTVTYLPPAAPLAGGPLAATLTASVTIAAPVTGGHLPPPVTFSAPVALTVVAPPAPPAVVVTPVAQRVLAAGAPVALAAGLDGVAGPVTWTLDPPVGAGTLAATTGATNAYTPPAAPDGPVTATVTARAGGVGGTATFTVLQGPPGAATRFSDPNPLDLGRLVHRLHRGKRLPTLYLASSTAPAPRLPSASPLPLPFLPGRNAPAPGAAFSVVGHLGQELRAGRVVARTDNFQPARLVAEGIAFPRDLRDCDACHRDAPQAGQVVDAISRRTCQGCHPDVWFGAAPITDLVHFAHPGGPQADDTRCVECHVAAPPGRPTVRAPIAAAHLPPALAAAFNQVQVEVTRVEDFKPGLKPRVWFRVKDRQGELTSLSAPVPASDQRPVASPVPRALARLAFVASGPTRDYLTGNLPFTQLVPLATTVDDPPGSGEFRHDFTVALPADAAGTWGLGLEARRTAPVPLYDPASDAFAWPYTGETLVEYADNPVVYLDTAFGSWPGGAPAPRRSPVERAGCRGCHLELSVHGGLRHDPSYCVLCHAADATDWSRRPKGPDGNTNLSTGYPDGRVGTSDGLEERSIHFKVLVHRIHTGAGQGTARLEVAAPHVVSGTFLDDVRFPNRLADCTLCHGGASWLLEAIPAGAAPTTANETGSIRHAAGAAHAAEEPALGPMTAACVSCHGTAFAYGHAARYTAAGVEQCAQCHLRGAVGVPAAHGLAAPVAKP